MVLFASGMAAATALLLTSLRARRGGGDGPRLLPGVRLLAEGHLEPRGVEVRLAPPAELESAVQGAQLLWLESPSNPKLEVYDLAALAETPAPPARSAWSTTRRPGRSTRRRSSSARTSR